MKTIFNAFAAVDNIRERTCSFAADHFNVRGPVFEMLRKRLGDTLFTDMLVEANRPFIGGDYITSLDCGNSEPTFEKPLLTKTVDLLKSHYPWKLYKHQIDAIQLTSAANNHKSLLVASGTASGKTETFLIPMLNRLMNDPHPEKNGVRVLLIYPLNALVSNQLDRLRIILESQTGRRKISFGKYIGTTSEKAGRNERGNEDRIEILSRETMRHSPPDILVTNYTMLEMMMLRGADRQLFQNSSETFHTLIIDEAHFYQGALGADIAGLFHRFKSLMRSFEPSSCENIQCFLTSATMGGGRDKASLQNFASALTGNALDSFEIVFGERMALEYPNSQSAKCDFESEYSSPAFPNVIESTSFEKMKDLEKLNTALQALDSGFFNEYISKRKGHAGSLAWLMATSQPWMRSLLELLEKKPLPWSEVKKNIPWKTDRDTALGDWLRLVAFAREYNPKIPKEERYQMPIRFHFGFRSPSGLQISLKNLQIKNEISVFLESALQAEPAFDNFPLMFSAEEESWYLFTALYVKEDLTDTAIYPGRAMQSAPKDWVLHNSKNCPKEKKIAALDDYYDGGDSSVIALQIMNFEKVQRLELIGVEPLFQISPKIPGSFTYIQSEEDCENDTLFFHPHKAKATPYGKYFSWELVSRKEPGNQDETVEKLPDLINFRIPADLMINAVLDNLYPHLSYDPESVQNATKPAGGRTLLTFSDSRQGAAGYAAKLERNRRQIAFRHHLWKIITEKAEFSEEDYNTQNAALYAELPGASPSRKEEILSELTSNQKRYENKISFVELRTRLNGKLPFFPIDNDPHYENMTETERKSKFIARILFTELFIDCDLERQGFIITAFDEPAQLITTIEDLANENLFNLANYKCTSFAKSFFRLFTLWMAKSAHFHFFSDDHFKNEMETLIRTTSPGEDSFFKGVILGVSETTVPLYKTGTENKLLFNYGTARPLSSLLKSIYGDNDNEVPQIRNRITNFLNSFYNAVTTHYLDQTNSLYIVKDGLFLNADLLNFKYSGNRTLCNSGHLQAGYEGNVCWKCKKIHSTDPEEIKNLSFEDFIASLRKGSEEKPYPLLRLEHPDFGLPLLSCEDTAQIKSSERIESENLFKEGKVNLLASSTTMELGIDLADLNCVLLTNLPPHPHNYIQRAGRAGRRSDSTSLVVTSLREDPHDLSVFRDPAVLITQPENPPRLAGLTPEKKQRHSNAWLLSWLLNSNQNGNINEDADLDENYEEGFRFETSTLRVPINKVFTENFSGMLESSLNAYRTASFSSANKNVSEEEISNFEKRLKELAISYRNKISDLDKEMSNATQECKTLTGGRLNAKKSYITYLEIQKGCFEKELFRDHLVRQGVLPSFGFPIEILGLNIFDERQKTPKLKFNTREGLERNYFLGIREFSPGMVVVRNKRVYTSAAISKNWFQNEETHSSVIRFRRNCLKCGEIWIAFQENSACPNPECYHTPESIEEIKKSAVKFLRPEGFTAKPYSTLYTGQKSDIYPEINYTVAEKLADEGWHRVGDFEILSEHEKAMIVYNNGAQSKQMGMPLGYRICQRCGYAIPDTPDLWYNSANHKWEANNDNQSAKDFLTHTPAYKVLENKEGNRCFSAEELIREHLPTWENLPLAIDFLTDRLCFRLEKTCKARLENELTPYEMAILLNSLGWVMVDALGKLLGIDSRNLGFCKDEQKFELILFENEIGGSGMIGELFANNDYESLLAKCKTIIDCPNECADGCHHCIVTFSNSRDFENGFLNRNILKISNILETLK